MPVMSLFSVDNMAAPPVAPCSEALIIEIERCPWLWNASRMDYRDTGKRKNSWKAIGIAFCEYDLLTELYNLRLNPGHLWTACLHRTLVAFCLTFTMHERSRSRSAARAWAYTRSSQDAKVLSKICFGSRRRR